MQAVQIIALVIAVVFLVEVAVVIRSGRLRERLAFFWLLIGLAGIVVALAIPLLNRAADRLGVDYMPTLVFAVAFTVTLEILMLQSSSISHLQEQVKALIQELAITKRELRDLREEAQAEGRQDGTD